jgi:sigma-B regulation protein RsbU (phosphoserine phosphatase)
LFHPGTGLLHLTNAGHEPPLHFDLRTERFISIPADAPPLGISQDIAGPDGFPVTELFLAGGMLYVFTDGLTEATTFGGGMLGIDGVRALIRDHAEETPDLRLKSIRIPARADRLKLIRAATEQAARYCDASDSWTFDLKMAVDEACQNIVRHAYGTKAEGDIMIDFTRERDTLVVDIMDFAAPVDPDTIKPRNLSEIRPGGLGVHLIKSVCDDARFVPPPPGVGNLFKLTKSLPNKVS